MKTFIKEHGGVVISSLVVVLLIAVCTVIKPLAADANNSIVQKLFEYVSNTLDNSSENDFNDVIGLYKISVRTGLTDDGDMSFTLNIISYFPDTIDIEDGYVVVNGTKTLFSELSYNQVEGGKEYYIPQPNLAPAKFANKYTVQYYDSSETLIKETTTSIKDHLMQIINDANASSELKQYAIDLLNLGAYCQIYFDENISDLANSDLTEAEKDVSNIVANSDNDFEVNDNLDGVSYYGGSLNLKAPIKLNVYFTIDEGSVGDYVFKLDGQTFSPLRYSGNMYFICLRGVTNNNLNYKHTFTVSKGDDSVVVNYSVLSYANTIIGKYSNSEDAKNLQLLNIVKALCALSDSAKKISSH